MSPSDDDLTRPLTGASEVAELSALSARGAPRGAPAVMAGARATMTARRRRRRQARIAAAGGLLGAVSVVALVAGLGLVGSGSDDRDGTVETEGPAPTVTPDPSSSTSSSTTTSLAAPSPTTPTSVAPEVTAPATGDPSGEVRPGPDSTGPTDTSALVRRTADEVEAMMRPGAVIENVDITGGNVDVVADDVTIRNFRLDAGGAPYGFRSTSGATGFVAEDGEIQGTGSAAFWGSHATLRRLDIHDSEAGAFKPVSGVTIERSWWHHLGRGGSGSANGVQFQGDTAAADVVIRSNFCDLPVTVPAPYGSSSCVIVSTDAAVTASIEGNWLNGGNHTVECNDQPGVTVHANRFGRDHRYGPLSGCPTTVANTWSDTGAPLP